MPTLTADRPAPPRRDIVADCERNIDADLAKMAPHERLPELRRIHIRFVALQARFFDRIDSGKFPEFGESAVDYELMIAAISKRIAEHEARS